MKKLITIIVVCSLLVGGVFYFINKSGNNRVNEYLVINNLEGDFDYLFDNNVNVFFSVPNYISTTPFEDIKILESLESIEKVYPYYQLYIRNVDGSKIQYKEDSNDFKQTEMPLKGYYDDGNVYYVEEIACNIVTNQENFEYSHTKYGDDVILKSFDSDSGVYISEVLYKNLEVEEGTSKLTITVPMSVPVICEKTKTCFEGLYDYNEHKIITYEEVLITLDIQGVIKNKNTQIKFCNSHEIIIPYELSEEIVRKVDYSKYTLEENQSYWKPNACIVELKDGVERMDFANEIYGAYGSVIFETYDYGIDLDAYKFKIDGNDLQTWPKI